jgi:hypothetical protein
VNKKPNSIAKKIFCHPSRETQARHYRTDNHPDFNVIIDDNANPNWLYIVMANGKVYHHFVGIMSEGNPCQIH